MVDIDITLKAKNSNGEHKLYLTSDEGEYWFTLCGDYKGAPIQIDFDELKRSDLEEMKTAIELVLEAT